MAENILSFKRVLLVSLLVKYGSYEQAYAATWHYYTTVSTVETAHACTLGQLMKAECTSQGVMPSRLSVCARGQSSAPF